MKNKSMKRNRRINLLLGLSGILCMLLFTIAGCSVKEIILNTEETLVNTMLITKDFSAKVVYIEEFDEPYYNLTELEEFVKGKIDSFNNTSSNGKISVDEIKLRDGKALMTLSFENLGAYSEFSEADAFFYAAEDTDLLGKIPVNSLVSIKDGSYVTKDVAVDGKKLKLLIINEAYDVIVNGKIKYYSDNVTLVDENTVQTPEGAVSVIIYR